MAYIGHTDFYTEVRKGNVPGHAIVHKFGRNDDVGSSWEGIHLLSGAFVFRTTAAQMRVKAGNVADTAGGTGAQAITIEGLDGSLAAVSESVATAGTSASSATSASFFRVFRAYVSPASAGTYGTIAAGSNTAAVVIEDSGGAADMISIGIGEGQSQYAAYAIPAGKTGYFLGAHISTDGNKNADIKVMTRANLSDVSTPFEPKRLKLHWDGLTEDFTYAPKSPGFSMAAGTDIWAEAQAAATTVITADFELLLVDD